MLKHKLFLILLIFTLIALSVQGAVFQNGTNYQHGNSTYTTRYTMGADLVADNITIEANYIIFNNSDNVSLIPSSSLNLTVINWSVSTNTLNITGDNSSVAFVIKINNTNAKVLFNGTQRNSPLNVTSYTTSFNYSYDVSAPNILTINDGTAPQNFSVDVTLSEIGNATLFWSRNIDLSSNTVNYSTTYATSHNFSILNLQVTSTYYYQVNGTDMLGNVYNSAIRSVTTQAGGSHGNDGSVGGGGGGTYFSAGGQPINDTIVIKNVTVIQNQTPFNIVSALQDFFSNKTNSNMTTEELDSFSIQNDKLQRTILFGAVFLAIILIFGMFIINKK